MSPQYTDDPSPEILATMVQSPFTSEQLAEISDEEQEAFCRAHPVTAIYRLAVTGCLTRRGGTGDGFNPNLPDNGQWGSVLDNDDVIICTPQSSSIPVARQGEFLAVTEGA